MSKKRKKLVNSLTRDIGISKTDEDLLSEYYAQCSWPKAYYSNLTNLARLTQGMRILEVGVAYGYHAEYILENLPGSLYTGIDPYLANYDIDDAFSRDISQIFHDDPQVAMDRLYIAVCNRLNHKHKDRFKIIRESSKIALSYLDNNSFDIIFIDGDHRYETVSMELSEYWTKLKEGGVLAGDDYEWPGVARAVEEFAIKNRLETSFLSNKSRGYPTYFFQKR